MKQEFQALGHIVKTPELRMTKTGLPYTYLTIACRSQKNLGVMFIDILLNKNRAINACDFLKKGDVVFATGELRIKNTVKRNKSYFDLQLFADTIRYIPYRHKKEEISNKGLVMSDKEGNEVKKCRICGIPIPAERLEAIPDTERCILCQQSFEKGEEIKEEPIYCERCGAEMIWRIRKSVSPTKYFLGCSNYPKCTYVVTGTW
jgi:single-stranded DNA-binding protein